MSFIKRYIRLEIGIFLIIATIATAVSCSEKKQKKKDLVAKASTTELNATTSKEAAKPVSEAFKKYWYAGEAEITSYELKQARYGELRDGKAVLVYVTEPFSDKDQVKSDYPSNEKSTSVLKLNATKNFNTGIYPYSIMTSTFYPVTDGQHAMKITMSMQEWCGHVFTQLNNREQFEVESRSYFQSEGDQNFSLNKTLLENEIWQKIRINPNDLPTGKLKMIPSFEYVRLRHIELKPYEVEIKKATQETSMRYSLVYPSLNRSLEILFNNQFPYEVISWKETFKSGFGPNAKEMVTTAKKIKTIKSPYWSKNSNAYVSLRDTLGLD
ncbi:septum formation inhibitor Maf [Sungkyunkwania multivorans]|uniref:Septum formation inhibitor Maf n=1 Tax=Sungkyunkwania multivorans TaxID=1173618 RepID=A0ABW3CXJ1_9FLAO